MTLNLTSPWLSRFSRPSPHVSVPEISTFRTLTFFVSPTSKSFRTKASENDVARASASKLLDDELLSRVSRARDADEALEMIAERWERSGGVVDTADCCSIISAALDRNNADLALSVFYSMRSSFDQVASGSSALIERWKWSRPDVRVYTSLVRGLAASLRVSEALRMIADVCRVGVSPGEEVPFGKLVRCPSCMIAVAVAQPQHGIQIVSCSKCRYQYELVSGDIASIESEEIRISSCRTQHGCSSMEKGAKIPANNEGKHSCCCSLHCGRFYLFCAFLSLSFSLKGSFYKNYTRNLVVCVPYVQ